jgi:hypothetical protein
MMDEVEVQDLSARAGTVELVPEDYDDDLGIDCKVRNRAGCHW